MSNLIRYGIPRWKAPRPGTRHSFIVTPAGGSGVTPVSTTRSTTWNVKATTTATKATTWDVLSQVSATRATTWDVLARVSAATRSTTWDTLSAVASVVSIAFQIPSGKVASNLTAFVTRLNLADFPGAWWTYATAGAIRVKQAGTLVPVDVTRIDAATQTGELFFKASLLSASNNDFTFEATSGQSALATSDPNGRDAVWSDYAEMVVPSSGSLTNRTGGASPSLAGTTGITLTANGLSYASPTGKVTAGSLSTFTQWTVGIRARQNVNDGSNRAMLSYSTNSVTDSLRATLVARSSSGKFSIWNSTDSFLDDPGSSTATELNNWHRWNYTHNATTDRKIWRDGVLAATDTTCAQRPTGGDTLFIGVEDNTGAENWGGDLDYFYLRNGVLSADWLAAENASWHGSTFYTVGAATVTPVTRSTTWRVEANVVATKATTWDVLSSVATTRATTWDVLAGVSTTKATTWNVKAQVSATRATTWDVLAAVSASRATTWDVLGGLTASRSTTWDTLAQVSATRATTWDVLAGLTATRSTTWRVLATVTATRATTWDVAGTLASVSTTRSTTWRVLETVTGTRATTWDVLAQVTSTRATSWDVLASAATTRTTSWRVLATVTTTRSTTWNVAGTTSSVSTARSTTWRVLSQTTGIRTTSWDVLTGATTSRTTNWRTLTLAQTARVAQWRVLALVTLLRSTTWNVGHEATLDLDIIGRLLEPPWTGQLAEPAHAGILDAPVHAGIVDPGHWTGRLTAPPIGGHP